MSAGGDGARETEETSSPEAELQDLNVVAGLLDVVCIFWVFRWGGGVVNVK